MQSLLHTTFEVELRLLRRDLQTIERAMSRGPELGPTAGCSGISLARYRTLQAIAEGGSGLSQLAKELEIEPSTLTRSLDALEALGLVERSPAPDNRRSMIARLTEAGSAKADAIDQAWNEWFERSLDSLKPEDRRCAIHGIACLAAAFRSRTDSTGAASL